VIEVQSFLRHEYTRKSQKKERAFHHWKKSKLLFFFQKNKMHAGATLPWFFFLKRMERERGRGHIFFLSVYFKEVYHIEHFESPTMLFSGFPFILI
jgi:hypothetical protein